MLAAAIGGALLNPLDQVSAWVGSPVPGQPPLMPAIGSTISVGAGTRTPMEEPAFHISLARPEGESAVATGLPSSEVDVATSLDDALLFVADPRAVTVFHSDTAPVVSPVAVAQGADGVSVSANAAAFAGGTVGVARTGDDVAFFLRAPTLSQPTRDADSITVTGTQSGKGQTGTVRLSESGDLGANVEYVRENMPPNAAPVAADDKATVDEDSSVIIDVLANDTDADAGQVLRIGSWDWKPANGTVTQEANGKLKYTPFPNVPAGMKAVQDTFTYTATDDRDTSNTATVTVTINPVNDTPIAFNDAMTFDHPNGPFDPTTVTYTQLSGGNIFGNDRDADGWDGTVYDVDTTGTVGTVAVNTTTGVVTWSGPKSFFGATQFKYRAIDSGSVVTDWATVKLWAKGPDGTPYVDGPGEPFQAVDDLVPIGDDTQSFNVLSNDTGGAFAVLVAQPSTVNGQLTAFDFGGNATYTPLPGGSDVNFSYRLYKADGTSLPAAVQMPKVDLEIFNGQDGAAVRDVDETKIGAFTVTNWNDTDGDGTQDNKEGAQGVLASQGVGTNEVDLMCVRVYNPAAFGKNAGDAITVKITGGEAEFFTTSKREGSLGTKIDLNADSFKNPVAGQPPKPSLDFWVEASAPSQTLRSIEIEMAATLGGVVAKDHVAATGIWTGLENGGFHTAGNTPGADADGRAYIDSFEGLSASWDAAQQKFVNTPGFSLGTPDMFVVGEAVADGKGNVKLDYYSVHLRNVVEFEYFVQPSGVGKEPGVVFDMTRTVEAYMWQQEVGGQLTMNDQRTFPTWRDKANDDGHPNDEDNIPNGQGQHIYSMDSPGWGIPVSQADYTAGKLNRNMGSGKSYARFVQRMNGEEFVRVKLNGDKFDHTPALAKGAKTLADSNAIPVQGSRAASRYQWHSWSDFTWDAAQSKWVRTANPAQPPNGAGQMASRNDLGSDHYLRNTPDAL